MIFNIYLGTIVSHLSPSHNLPTVDLPPHPSPSTAVEPSFVVVVEVFAILPSTLQGLGPWVPA